MLSLASRYGNGNTSSNEIAGEQEVSRKYLERILSSLKAAGLVEAEKGVQGGYALTKSPSQISLYDILVAMGEDFQIVFCTESEEKCHRSNLCATREVWCEISETVSQILNRTTLADLERKLTKLAITESQNTSFE